MSSDVLQALRTSHKGSLSYDRWHSDNRLQEIFQECSSPPLSDSKLLAALEQLQVRNQEDALRNSFSEGNEEDRKPSRSTYGRYDSEDELVDEEDDKDTHNSTMTYNHKLDVSIQQKAAKMELERRQVDKKIKKEVNRRIEKRLKHIQKVSKKLEEQADQDVSLKLQEREVQQRVTLQRINDLSRESEDLKERRLLQQQAQQEQHLKRLDAIVKAALQKKAQEEAERKKRREIELQNFIASLAKVKKQIDDHVHMIIQNIESCPHQEILAPVANKIKDHTHRLQSEAEQITRAAHGKPSSEPFQEMTHLIQSLLKLNEQTNKAIDAAEKTSQAQEQANLRAKEEEKKSAPVPPPQEKLPEVKRASRRPLLDEGAELDKFVSPDALAEYKELVKHHEEVINSYSELSKATDKMLKKKVFDLQKSVNTPINALSAQSGHHFLDKLRRLQDLLDGREVEVGSRRIGISIHPSALVYCKDLLAKKLVKQGQEQVSSNHESAFLFASLAIGLWCQYSDLGKLILAYFHHSCPFLVPYHIPKAEGISNEDYYKQLGYTFDNEGTIEKQDKYLKRMSGFTRLYAAILMSEPPPGCGQVNPHGIDKAWEWLTRILNLEPQPDITATMLFDFLEVCGHAMSQAYGQQFFKLIQVLVYLYFPKIEEVTPKGSGGPVMRLKSYLENCLKSRRFPKPTGILTQAFWKS